MKGIILCGGRGTRMGLYTQRVGNKHLMPVYNKLMIEFPIKTLVESGIKDITIVTGNRYSGQFVDVLGNGREWGVEHLSYAYQFGENGIADALRCAEPTVKKGQTVAVILGDNIFEDKFDKQLAWFKDHAGTNTAAIFLKQVENPQRFAVAEVDDKKKIINIIEKPQHPKSNHAVVGLYLYTYDVFEKINALKPSDRHELEVTDLNLLYLNNDKHQLYWFPINGYWHDAGTPDSLLECSTWIKSMENIK